VKNSPPKFISKLAPLVEINNLEQKVLILPQVRDEEGNNWKLNVFDSMNNKLPAFIEV
jgi:hypothetical protein